MKNIFAILYILIATGFVFKNPNEKCSFIYGRESSIIVFSGTVSKIKQVQFKGSRYEVSFYVDSVYKGEHNLKEINIYTSINPNCYDTYATCELCGYEFIKGNRYIVYVCSYENETYIVNQCTFTELLKDNKNLVLKSDSTTP